MWEQVADMSFHDQIIQMPNVDSYARMIVITCQKNKSATDRGQRAQVNHSWKTDRTAHQFPNGINELGHWPK